MKVRRMMSKSVVVFVLNNSDNKHAAASSIAVDGVEVSRSEM